MKNIYVKLLGNPVVIANDETVKFPYKKSEGIFYYICVKKEVLRDELINIFWPDIEDQTAKKRLRDALYKIKKVTSSDIFTGRNNKKIKLNTELVDVDIDNINSLSANEIMKLYEKQSSIAFLGRFLIKNSAEFENWLYQTRETINVKYSNKLFIYIKSKEVKTESVVSIKKITELTISLDPYNESAYRDIMNLLNEKNAHNEAIKLYYDLVKLLKNDLLIEPEKETKNLFEKISLAKNTTQNSKTNYFYGRLNEKEKILDEIFNFSKEESCKSISLKGEAGVGKSALINQIVSLLNNNLINDKTSSAENKQAFIPANFYINNMLILKTNCYAAESEFSYKPLNTIIEQLGKYIDKKNIEIPFNTIATICSAFPNFSSNKEIPLLSNLNAMNFTNVTSSINKVIKEIGKKHKIILFIDDLQWIDNMSYHLISNILYEDKNKNILLITAYRNDYEYEVKEKLLPIINKGLLTEIKIERFNKKEVNEIISTRVRTNRKMSIDNKSIDKIFSETEGNALFLIEVINLINDGIYTNKLSYKSSNIIESRIIGLNKIEKNILNTLSIFFQNTDFEMLSYLLDYDDITIYNSIESLIEKYLIEETVENNKNYYRFSHQKIRIYIYNKQSQGKLKLLHKIVTNKYTEIYENTENLNILSSIIYHAEKADEYIIEAKYKLEFAKEFYTAYHESFPTVSNDFSYTDPENASVSLGFLENLWLNFENNTYKGKTEIEILKIELSFILARLYISQADYENGLEKLSYSMSYAQKYNYTNYLLEDYKQIIFYSIQVGDIKKMKLYLDKAFSIIDSFDLNNYSGYHTTNKYISGNIIDSTPHITFEEIQNNKAAFERLIGLYFIKIKNYDNATSHLMTSIEIAQELSNEHKDLSMAIAASYNYLGIININKNKYSIALKYFTKSIELCHSSYSSNGMGIFYSNAGQALYKLSRIQEALKYLNTGVEFFIESNTIWGRDMAEFYIAAIYKDLGNSSLAIEHYKISNKLAKKIENPATLKLLRKYYKENK